jgi:hypothetical protein
VEKDTIAASFDYQLDERPTNIPSICNEQCGWAWGVTTVARQFMTIVLVT